MDEKQIRHYETTVAEQQIFSGKIISVAVRDVVLENGERAKREVVYHNGGAAILPIDSDNNVYLVRQFRSAFNKELLEVPAGKLEKGEDPFKAAVRELKEESGFTAKQIIPLGEYLPTVGYSTEKLSLYLARELTAGDTDFDSDEFISLVKIPFDEAYQMCMDGRIQDGKTVVALLKAKNYI